MVMERKKTMMGRVGRSDHAMGSDKGYASDVYEQRRMVVSISTTSPIVDGLTENNREESGPWQRLWTEVNGCHGSPTLL